LKADQKQIRFNISRELLRIRSVERRRQWQRIVTIDESCFALYNLHDLIGIGSGEITIGRKWQRMESLNCALAMLWNPSGFYFLKARIKGGKFKRQSYPNNILRAI
jgi:hypothetical protein